MRIVSCILFHPIEGSREIRMHGECQLCVDVRENRTEKQTNRSLQVCRDVFATELELKSHEILHKYPGGYAWSMCDAIFRNDAGHISHEATTHQVCLTLPRSYWIWLFAYYNSSFCGINSYSNVCGAKGTKKTLRLSHLETKHKGNGRHAMCTICGAQFEQKSYLRLHAETNCGQLGTLNCSECGVEYVSEIALSEHTRTSLAIILTEDDCIKLEENPLNLPKFEVSLLSHLANGTEDDLQTHDDSMTELELAIDDDNALDVGNAGAQTDCQQSDGSQSRVSFIR